MTTAPSLQFPLQFPSPTFPNLIYNATTQTLSLTISQNPPPTPTSSPTPTQISSAEESQLLALSNDPGFTSAIQQLYKGPATDVSPVVLPPITLPAWLNFNAASFQISFTGAMSDSQRQQLNFSSDPTYQAAVDSLYNQRTILGAELVGTGDAILATQVTPPHPAPISATATSLPVRSAVVIPAVPFVAAIGNEQVLVTGAEAGYRATFGTVWTVTRGYNNTTATDHNLGDSVFLNAITNHVNQILAALRISAQDLALIRSYTGLVDSASGLTPLNLANLSMLCRYAFLAQALNLSVSDLITVIQVMGVDPFQQQDPVSTLGVVQAIQAIQASPFSIAQLNYLYRNSYDRNAGIAPLSANVSLLLTTLQAGLASVAFNDAIVPDPKGDLLLKAMGTLLGTSLAGAALGLINGTGVFSAPLPALLGISLQAEPFVTYDPASMQLSCVVAMSPGQLLLLSTVSKDPIYQAAINNLFTASNAGGTGPYAVTLPALLSIVFPTPPTGSQAMDAAVSAISYDSASQQLRFTGPMTKDEKTALLTLSSDPMYQAAITNLWQQPRDFINANFANPNGTNFLDFNEAVNELIDIKPPLTTAQKVLYVAQQFMPYLQKIQSKSLITQTLCDNLGLSPTIGDLLLNTILNSQLRPAPATAMSDFLALAGDGLARISHHMY